MPKGARYREQVLDEAFFGDALPWRDAAHFTLSLHTGEPEDAEGKLINETTYPGYAPATLARDRLTWARKANRITNRVEIRCGTCDEFEQRIHMIRFWSLRPAGAGIAYQGEFAPPIRVTARVRVVVDPGTVEIVER